MRPTTTELASRSARVGCTSCHTILAATNKLLAKSNKSQTGVKATKKRSAKRSGIRRLVRAAEDECHKTMTLQEAKSIARHLRLTLRQVRSGAYRVNFREGNETTAYYTDNLEDSVKTALEMARTRGVGAVPAMRPGTRSGTTVLSTACTTIPRPPGRKWTSEHGQQGPEAVT